MVSFVHLRDQKSVLTDSPVRKQAGVNGLPKLEGYDKKLLEKEQKGEQSQKNGD